MKARSHPFVAGLTLLAPLVLAPSVQAQEESEAREASSAPDSTENAKALAKKLKALEREFTKARSEVMTEMNKLPEEKRMAFYDEHRPDPEDYVPRFFELAERAAGTETAARCFNWIIGNSQENENFLISMDMLLRDHIDADCLAEVCLNLMYHDQGAEALENLIAESRNPNVLGHATYYLGKKYADGLDWGAGPPDAREQSEAYLEKVIADYPSHATIGRLGKQTGSTLGEDATRILFAVRNLVIGKVAPDIEGEDIDGVSFKLSDYRGKVVLLDFWGHW